MSRADARTGTPHTQASIAKINRPRVDGAFARTRLFDLLNQCKNYPATWLSAPAGSGKTTLVAGYLESNKIPSIWYQIDERDHDLGTFFYYMGLAGKRAAPGSGVSLPLLSSEYLQSLETFTLRYFESLYRMLKPPFVLVLDNYHEVRSDSSFHDVICRSISCIPEGIRLIVISRKDPLPQFARLRANSHLFLIEPEQVWFTLDESKGLLHEKSPVLLEDDVIEGLHERIRGWAAGLVLIMESARIQGIDYQRLPKLASNETFDYFAHEIFGKADSVTQKVLLKTAFLPKMTASMAEELTGNSQAREVLFRLYRDNFFTQRDGQTNPFYQYHPLFREFLLSRVDATMEPLEVISAKRKSAALIEKCGDVTYAIELLVEINDWREAVRTITAHAADFVAQGRGQTIDVLLDRFPEDITGTSSWLMYWRGVCRMTRDPVESRTYHEKAFEIFETEGNEEGVLLAWAGIIDSILYGLDDFALADRWIAWLDERLKRTPSFPSPRIEAIVVVGMSGAIFWRSPYRADAGDWFRRAVAVAAKAGDKGLQIRALSRIIVWSVWMGHFSNMTEAALRAEMLARTPGMLPSSLLSWKYAEAMMSLTMTRGHEKAIGTVNEGLEISNQSGVHILDEMLLVFGIWECFTAGDTAAAATYLSRLAMTGPAYVTDMMYRGLSAWWHFVRGDIGKATTLTKTALEMSLSYGLIFPQMLACHLAAAILQGARRYDQAGDAINRLRNLIPKLGEISLFGYICYLDEAQLLLNIGKEDEALGALRSAMAIGKELDCKTLLFHWQPKVLARLCAKALEHDIETDFVRDLIRALDLFPDAPPLQIANWPWPLRVFTLGVFKIEREGKPIQFSGKVRKKPLALLKTLIALGGDHVSQTQIADLLWPEAEGDSSQIAFRTTLSRLRQLIGDNAITNHGGELSLNPSCCWVDAFALEQLLHQCSATDDDERIIALVEESLRLYLGHFLEGDELDEFLLKDRLRNGLFRLISRACEHLEKEGRRQESASMCERAIAIDNCAEECYQHLIVCYHHLGFNDRAVEAYRRCRSALASHLGARPSARTEAIRESIA